MNYNIQRMHKPDMVIHSAVDIPTTDDYCATACGKWLSTDKYIVTVKPVTCAKCLTALGQKDEDHAIPTTKRERESSGGSRNQNSERNFSCTNEACSRIGDFTDTRKLVYVPGRARKHA